MKSLYASSLAALLLTTACDGPPVVPTADKRQNTETARIEGQVVVQSKVRGDVIVLLYAADRPPPPEGSGRPITFTIIPMEQVFGQDLDRRDAQGLPTSGPFIAPFAFSLVPEGKYLVRGFVDADTCRWVPGPLFGSCHAPDFNPFYGVTGEPNQFDVGGAAVNLNGARPTPLVVDVGRDADNKLAPALGVSVSFSDNSALVPFDRPAFEVDASTVAASEGLPRLLTLVPRSFNEGAIMQGAVSHPAIGRGFFVRVADKNGDGIADDANADGKPDAVVWPRVIVRKLSDEVLVPFTDENDLDRNGALDAAGVEYEPQMGTKDGKPDAVILYAAIDTTGFSNYLRDANGQPSLFGIVPKLSVTIANTAINAANPAAPAFLAAVPPGRYSITLMQETGQTWRLPNEMSPSLAAALGLPASEPQGFIVQVP